jgi:hypothetical protein
MRKGKSESRKRKDLIKRVSCFFFLNPYGFDSAMEKARHLLWTGSFYSAFVLIVFSKVL